jgi:iron complex outermembrane recepter protein
LLQNLRAFISLAFLFILTKTAGQPLTCPFQLAGKVVDVDNNPLSGATVYIPSLDRGTTTDSAGVFLIADICAETILVEVRFIGFKSLSQKVKLRKNDLVEFKLASDELVLSEIIVQEHYNHISKTQSTSALTGSALDAVRSESFGKALRGITGVNTIQAGPAIFKPIIHGVHGQRILILNNGLRHEGQQWGAEHAPEIDPFLASNIVVVKDASAIKYGTDALGGVVIVNPAELPTKPGIGGMTSLALQGNGRGGSFSTMLEGASKEIKGLRWRTHGTIKKLGDFSAADYQLTNTGVEELNFSAALGYHKSERVGYELFYSHFSTQVGILKGSSISTPNDLDQAFTRMEPTFTGDFSYDIGSPRQEVTHDLLKVNAHVHEGNNTFTFQYGLQINQRKEFDLRRSSLNHLPAIDLTLYTHTLDGEWEYESASGAIRCLGINGLWQDNNNNPGTQRLPFIPNFVNYSGGVYGIQKVKWSAWEAEAGLRFDYRNYSVSGRDFSNQLYKSSLTFANVSATAGLTHTINNHHSFTLGASTAWRPPHVSELYSIGTHQSAAAIEYGLLLDEQTSRVLDINSVDFKNEQVLKSTGTYRYTADRTQVEMTGYFSYIYNFIFLRPEGITRDVRGVYPFYRYRQTDASFTGLDMKGDYSITPAFTASVKASLLWAKDVVKNDFFLFIPSQRGEVSLRYEKNLARDREKLIVETTVQWVARQYRGPERIITPGQLIEAQEQGINLFETDKRNFDFKQVPDAYTLLSVNAVWEKPMGESKLSVRVGSENLANIKYREYTNRLRYFADDIGRNVSLAVTYSF